MKRTSSSQLATRRYAKRPYKRSLIPRNLSIPRLPLTTYNTSQVAIPRTRTVNFQYDSVLTPVTTIGQVGSYPVALNDAFDFDRTTANVYGNKQPLFFDNLVSTSSYTNQKVVAWEVTYTVINLAAGNPLQVFVVSAAASPTLFDSETKASNLPGVIKKVLTPSGGSDAMCSVTVRGNIADLYPGYNDDSTFTGTNTSGPGVVIYGGLTLYATAGTVSAAISVQAKMVTQLFARTALIS